ncbi:MAG: DNA polymerase III subunit gamma/tau [Bacteroidales bacterium]
MNNFIVSARKYRPSTFRSVVGQKALTQTLKNSVATKKLAHAYLFCGPRGVGKTTCARIFAKTINCFHPTADGEACNACESCVSFNENRSYNIHELDAASNNSVDDIRVLIDQVRISPQIGEYKVYIIDEVHMLSSQAFNAFLKTLEEPPHHAIFVLATTEKHKILPTILSRCQIYDFNRISINDTVEHLAYVASQEGVSVEPEALNVIAQKADGGMRDALSIFDQVVSFTEGNVTYRAVIDNLNILDYEYYFRITDAFLAGDFKAALLIFNDILSKGFEGQNFITGLSSHLRDLLVSKDQSTITLLEVAEVVAQKYAQQAANCSNDFLFKSIELTNECDLSYRASKNKRLLIELTLIRLCRTNVLQEGGSGSNAAMPSIAVQTAANSAPQPAQATVRPQQPQPVVQTSTAPAATQPIASQSPTAKSSPTPPPKGNQSAPPKAFSLVGKAKSEESAAQATRNQNMRSLADPFTQEQLLNAWKDYTKRIPERTMIIATMKAATPQIAAGFVLQLVVDNEIQKEKMTEEATAIVDFLRQKLRNYQISLQVSVNQQDHKKAFSKREILEELLSENQTLAELVEKYDLVIA